ncbi:MAG: hypothetical protein ACE5H4_09385 [Candidatus Thorarchaeota archaeon]
MAATTRTLILNEIRMMWNQFKRTATNRSMLMFYSITIIGVYFVSTVISAMLSLGPVLLTLKSNLETSIDRGMVFTAFGILSASSVVGGYFGLGPAALVSEVDESVLMTSPVEPHQLFIGRYTRRFTRKMIFAFTGVLAVFPLVTEANLLVLPLSMIIVTIIIFFEVNYFLGGIAAYLRIKLSLRTKSVARHVTSLVLGLLVFLPSLPLFTDNFVEAMSWPPNSVAYVLTEAFDILNWGYGPGLGIYFLHLSFVVSFLVLVGLCDRDYYEAFAASAGKDKVEGRFNRILRGQVDFSSTRFNDPMFWIILKDFWSRMRSPMQILKYAYAVIGTGFVIYLSLFAPPGFLTLNITPAPRMTVLPTFLLLLLLMIQVTSVTSLTGFVDESENVYLLKAGPFRPIDIVLAKYVLSVVEVAIAAIPILGFIGFFFQLQGVTALMFLAAPLILLFSAVGTAIGAYVPVVTNEPGNLPVPLAFSFPIINLTLGGFTIALAAALADSLVIVVALPAVTLAFVFLFVIAAVSALDRYK